KGHIKDLPKKLGVDVQHGFKETYEIVPTKEKVVAELRSASKKADRILLATDPDREGEAIAFHVADVIKDAKESKGLFTVWTRDEKAWIEIAPGQFDKPLFFSVNPLLTAVGAHLLFGERVGRWLGLAIALGLGGIAILGYADLRLEGDDWLGDLLSLACAVFFAAYFLLGKRLRGRLDNRAYVAGVYLVAALSSLAALLALGQPLTGYSPRTWLCFGLMALVPTLLGHTLLNHALRYLDASFVSAATLSEPALAGLVAYFAWGEGVSAAAGLGYALIAGAVLLLILDQREVARRA
ncbi:MAG TPA: EamA family transporter, partial [Myxococcota bacterium]|nr:EamA family transporter [Myxococcota bacterium]